MNEYPILVAALICEHCGFVDDLVPDVHTGQSRRCPCPHHPDDARERSERADKRLREARALAQLRERRAS